MQEIKEHSPASIIRRSLYRFFIIFIPTGSLISGLMMIFYRLDIKTDSASCTSTWTVSSKSMTLWGMRPVMPCSAKLPFV